MIAHNYMLHIHYLTDSFFVAYLGEKSSDPESPAYIPTIFQFTSSSEKRKADQSMVRFQAVKRRRQCREEQAAVSIEDKDNSHDRFVGGQCDIITLSVEVQTDLTLVDITALEHDCQQRMNETHLLKEQINRKSYPLQESLKNDARLLTFYTGLTSMTVFASVFNFVSSIIPQTQNSKLTQFECFILTLMKLRLNLSNYDLSLRFAVSETTVGRVFSKWITAMDCRLSPLIKWPDRECLQKTMPFCYRRHYGLRVVSIIDCFELFIEKPSNLLAKACTWSTYKHYNTAKYLISVTPQGSISFISKGWGGRTSDKYITEHSGYLNNLLPGDIILADRGFDVADSVAIMGASLELPAFTKGREQLSASEIENTRKMANVRIHVERAIGAVCQKFTILSATGVITKELVQTKSSTGVLLDSIVRVCCALHNLCEGIVPFT